MGSNDSAVVLENGPELRTFNDKGTLSGYNGAALNQGLDSLKEMVRK